MALSRKERGPGVAGRCCARERVVLCARVRIGQETGSMRCTCINNVFSHSAVLAGDGSGEMPISESESVLLIFVRFGCRLGAEISESESVLLIFVRFGCRLGAEISESESVLLIFVRFGCRLGAEISEPESVV